MACRAEVCDRCLPPRPAPGPAVAQVRETAEGDPATLPDVMDGSEAAPHNPFNATAARAKL